LLSKHRIATELLPNNGMPMIGQDPWWSAEMELCSSIMQFNTTPAAVFIVWYDYPSGTVIRPAPPTFVTRTECHITPELVKT